MSASKFALCVALPAASLAFATAAGAKDKPEPKSEYVEGLAACQSLTDPTARLACYDTAVARIVAAAAQGEVRVVDREDMERTRRRLFGFSLPDLGIFGDNKDDGQSDELDMLESTITSVSRTGDDAWIIAIEDGDAVWQIRDAPMRFARPRPGDKVVFKKAALGSYFIRVNGQIGVKGTRIR
jgi:hypothetical protein